MGLAVLIVILNQNNVKMLLEDVMTQQMQNNTYKVLGLLLQYPSDALLLVLDECYEALTSDALLSPENIKEINNLINHLKNTDILELQEEYVGLFDFKRLLSLYLFEHSHGDSRDRGQAMIDLIAHYEKNNLALQPGELPDYLPVFLEHLSFSPPAKAAQVLALHINTITVLEQRLQEHDSVYASLFNGLRMLSASEADKEFVMKAMKNYADKKDINKTIDDEWKEPEAFDKQGASCRTTPLDVNRLNKQFHKEH